MSAIVAIFALCFVTSTLNQAVAQSGQPYAVASRTTPVNTSKGLLNPEDQAEVPLLSELKVDRRTPQAVTVVLAPPGQPVATFVGAVTKDQIVAKIQPGPCAGGQCGPGGCCPAK